MRSLLSAVVTACLLSAAALGQSPAFTAADVHTSNGGGTYRSSLSADGRYQIWGATLVNLIAEAWGVDTATVYGGPSWLNSDRFDLLALAPAGSTPADRELMLRNLLTDRFGLALHEDKKPLPVFALLQHKSASQLKESAAGEAPGCSQEEETGPSYIIALVCRHTTMTALAGILRHTDASVTRPVVDRTGLQGARDFTIRYTPLFVFQKAVAGGELSPGIKLFDALEKTGLRLESQEQVVPVLAVDRANRTPTPNAPGIEARLPAAPGEFEVAHIRISKPGTEKSGDIRQGGAVEIHGYTLKDLIQYAWELDDNRVVTGQKWMDTDRYDIIAKAPPGSQGGEGVVNMMKALLIEQFNLTIHTADRPVPAILLTAGKNPKLKPADPANRSECTISRGQTGNGPAAMPLKVYTCQNLTMARFAELIRPQAAGYLRQPVVDQTGLTGAFDFTLSWTRSDVLSAAQNRKQADGTPGDPTGAITIFDSVEHQLGLKLETGKKFPLPVLIVDHAEPVTDDK